MYVGKDISVIIPTYYRYDIIGNVFDSLAKQTIQPYEIIVVDQTPLSDRPIKFYEKFKNIPLNVVNLKKPSLSISKNHGVSLCKTDLVLFLDDDVIFSPHLIENHLDVMNTECVDVVSGAVSDQESLPENFIRDRKQLDPLAFFLKVPNKKWNGMVLVQSGPNACIKKDIFIAVGGYDINLPRMEDIELGLRMFQFGAKMFYSEKPFVQFTRHPTGGTRETQKNIVYAKLVSRLYLYRKHFPGWSTRQYILREFLNSIMFKELVSCYFSIWNLTKLQMPFVNLWLLYKANKEVCKKVRLLSKPNFKLNI